MKQLVLDAGPLIALFYSQDSYHQEAVKGFQQLHQWKTEVLTPIPIIFEVYKWLLHRGGVKRAQTTLTVMYESLYPIAVGEKEFNQLRELITLLPEWQGTLEDGTVLLLAELYSSPIWTLNYRDFSRFKQLQFWTPD